MKKLRPHQGKLALLVLFALVFIGGALLAQQGANRIVLGLGGAVAMDAPAGDDATPVTFVVEQGESAASIGARLQEKGLIKSALAFRIQARSSGAETLLASGQYQIRANMRPSEIIALMRQPEPEPGIKVTFPEGWQAFEMADRLEASGVVPRVAFLSAIESGSYQYSFLNGRSRGASLEGYLFPDTYVFARGITATAVVETMLRVFDRRFDISLRQQAERQGLTIEQVVILASIVEREAVVPEERPMIAEVFLNRLALKMLLQADPTVQYAVARADPRAAEQAGYWKPDLTNEDLRIDSPYNTYRYRGLPPTAIANAGLDSLRATVSPTSTGYLYFVAKADGKHAFARTLDEHNDNVARYRMLNRAR